jgi:hypothetical protein
MQVTTICIDLAKNVFQIHGADQLGKAVLRKQLRRGPRMQSFGLDRVVFSGHHPRVTAFAGRRFLGLIRELQLPEWCGRSA